MAAIHKSPTTRVGVTIAAAVFMVLSALAQGAAPAGGESFTAAAADLQQIAGYPIEMHATAIIADDPLLPLICRAIVNGFRDADADPVTRNWLRQIVHVVVIEGKTAGQPKERVELKEKELTIRMTIGEAEINQLRTLVAEALKKVAHLKAAQPAVK